MKKFLFGLGLAFLALTVNPSDAFAKCGNALAYQKLDELPAFSGNPEAADVSAYCDNSTNQIKKTDQYQAPLNTAFSNTLIGNGLARTTVATATLAEINAGKTLLTGVVGKSIYVHQIDALSTGAFTTCTDVRVQDTNGSPILVNTYLVAALTSGAVLVPGAANTTPGAGLVTALTSGQGLAVVKTGSACAGGTSMTFNIIYSVQ